MARVPSISDTEYLEYLCYVCWSSLVAVVATPFVAGYNRLQLAAESVAPPNKANDVRRHVLSTTVYGKPRYVVADASLLWCLFTDTAPCGASGNRR